MFTYIFVKRAKPLRLAKTILMLFVTLFTFVGLPAVDTYLSIFNNYTEGFVLDLTEEEEREGSKNETKELENKLVHHQNELSAFLSNQLTSVAFHDHTSSYSSLIKEVTTPPPEQLIV